MTNNNSSNNIYDNHDNNTNDDDNNTYDNHDNNNNNTYDNHYNNNNHDSSIVLTCSCRRTVPAGK